MGLIMAALAFFASIFSSVLANELKDWTPRIVCRLINIATARLPKKLRKRFEEEWAAHIDALPGDITKLVVAVGFIPAAIKMSLILGESKAPQPSTKAHGAEAVKAMNYEVVYCDAPVALPPYRMIAAAFDASMVLVGAGMFLGIFFTCGGSLLLMKHNAVFVLSMIAILDVFYRFLWVLGNGETPGMRFAGLRLVNFDGRSPDRDQRAFRQVSSILSLLSAGLGTVWALVDEESLTWHDHISKTFPTVGG